MHTPGPWTTKTDDHTRVGPAGLVVAHVAGAHRENTDANARLIAAAPSMLDTLDRIANGEFATNVSPAEQVAAMRDIARAAIAHATQEPTP